MGNILLEAFKALNEADMEDLNGGKHSPISFSVDSLDEYGDEIDTIEIFSSEAAAIKFANKHRPSQVTVLIDEDSGINTYTSENGGDFMNNEVIYQTDDKFKEVDEKIDLSTIHKDALAAIESGTLKDAMGETLFKIGDLVSTGPHVSKGPYDFRNIKGTIDDVANFEGRNIYHIKALKSQKELPYFEEDELIKVEENESGNLNEADTPKFAPREDVIKALNSKPGFEDFTENEISKLIGIYARDTGRWPSQVEKAEEFIDFLDDIGGWAGFVFSTFGIERGLSEKMLPKIIKKDPKLLQATKDYVTKYLHNPKMDKPLTKDEDYVEYILDYTPNRDGTNYEKTENLDWIEKIYKNPTKAFAELDKYKEKLSNVLKTTK